MPIKIAALIGALVKGAAKYSYLSAASGST